MCNSEQEDGGNLFSGISSTAGASLFPVTSSAGSSNPTPLFASAKPAASTLFGLSTPQDNPIASQPVQYSPSSRHVFKVPNVPDLDDPNLHSPNVRSGNATITHWPAIKLSRLPAGLNRKVWIHRYFERFGTINRIITQPTLDAAYVAYDSVSAVQRAKRSAHDTPPFTTEHLPNTVLITAVQCRIQSKSSSDERSEPPTFTMPSTMANNQRLPKRDRLRQPDVKALPELSIPRPPVREESHEPSSPTQPQLDPSPISLEPKRMLFGTTAEERAAILQTFYKEDTARRPDHHGKSKPLQPGFTADFLLDSEDAIDVRFDAIRGSCVDMCPELERYLREVHHRVSIFECLPSSLTSSGWQMDHTRAVKDYERSSADQPVPLACELRPTPILQRTMSYMLASIVDRPELDTTRSLWKSWYEFMWTRTRAIRKDVVQQRLCCPQIVGVMEQVARFHVFCAARLVDQPIDSFDPQINSENLTQCLQTLKEMYNDLRDPCYDENASSPPPPSCPNEAEFRAYMLLMRLNDQGALNEVQTLPAHLLRSVEVRFVVNVHEAVTTNNYIRFFRLVLQADCLKACLMHRYFVQVRSQALVRLSSSFTKHPRRDVPYPLDTLVRQLGFEDTTEAKTFCQCWGLTIVDECVIFEKDMPPHPPELAWRDRRAIRLIEQKRSGTALSTLFSKAEVNAEDAIPQPVHSSFDNSGRFAFPLGDSVEPVAPSRPSVSIPTRSAPVAASDYSQIKPRDAYLTKVLSDERGLQHFVHELIEGELAFHQIAKQAIAAESVAQDIVDNVIAQTVSSELNKFADEFFQAEHECRSSRCAMDLSSKLTGVVVEEECRQLAQFSLAVAWASDNLLNDQLLPSIIQCICRRSWLNAKADQFHGRSLLRSHFKRLCDFMDRKRRVEQEHTMLRSMPACPAPHQSALSLIMTDLDYSSSISGKPDTPLSVVTSKVQHLRMKRPRFSSWSSRVDDKVIWKPVASIPQLMDHKLGVYIADFDSTNRKALSIITAWLRVKLIGFEPRLLPQAFRLSHLHALTAIICLGDPNDLILRLRLANHAVPTLILLSNRMDFPDPVDDFLKQLPLNCLVLPINNHMTPTRCWSSILDAGLDWITSKMVHRQSTVPQEAHCIPTSFSTGGPHTRLGDLVHRFMDANFLRPLATLSDGWQRQGLVNPSPESLFTAYSLVLERLSHQLPPTITLELQTRIAVVPEDVNILSSPVDDNDAWSQLTHKWALFTDRLSLSYSIRESVFTAVTRSEHDFYKRCGCTVVVPPLIVAPWLCVCIVTVQDLLDQFTQTHLGSSGLETLGWKQVPRAFSHCDREEAINGLASHFSALGEPKTTLVNAIHQSVESCRRQAISHCLTHSKSAINSSALMTVQPADKNTILLQLDKLGKKMDTLEDSISDVLMETRHDSSNQSSNQIDSIV